MGIDLTLQALPDDFVLLTQLRLRPEIGQELAFCEQYWQRGMSKEPSPLEVEVFNALTDLKKAKPGIEGRNYYFQSREYAGLSYILGKYFQARALADLSEQIIYGSEVIHPDAQTGQGTLKFTPSVVAEDFLRVLKEIRFPDACELVSKVEMDCEGVYKSSYDFDEVSKEGMNETFEELKQFYSDVIRHGEGVLSFTW